MLKEDNIDTHFHSYVQCILFEISNLCYNNDQGQENMLQKHK